MHADIEARVREGLEAFNEGDLDRFVATMAEDARYRVAREHPESRLCEGRDQIRDYYRSWIDGVENPRVELCELIVEPPRVLMIGRFSGNASVGSIPIEVEVAVLSEVDDELRTVEAEEFLDSERARRTLRDPAWP